MTRRVVLASRLFTPEPAAASQRLDALVGALAERGVQVQVLTSRAPAGTAPGPAQAGVTVSRWPVRRDSTGAVRGWVPYLSFDLPLVLRLLTARKPQVYVVEPPPTTGVVVRVVARLRGVPYVYYAADLLSSAVGPADLPVALVRTLRAVESWVLRGAATVLTASGGLAAQVQVLGVPERRVVNVGSGVDTDVFHPATTSTDTPRTQRLVYAGTMSDVHGAEVFVRAFALIRAEFPEARLVMFGQGTQRTALIALAERVSPGAVDFPGVVPPAVVAAELQQAPAGLASLQPGSGYEFVFASKMFGISACGTPVVYAGPGPCADLVAEHGLGWAVTWEPDAVADALRAALTAKANDEDRSRRADWARANVSLRDVAERGADAVLGCLEPERE